MTTTVEMREVGKRYGRIEAVREVSFELPAAQKAKLPPELQHHEFVMRVTTERFW